MAESEKAGTVNMRTGEILTGEIGAAPEDALPTSNAPAAPAETIPLVVTHAEMLQNNKKRWSAEE